MKVLVAGATGFIGKELLKRLNDKGHEVIALTRNKDIAIFNIPIHCQIHQWDPSNKPLPTNIIKGVDVVINLAGENIASGFWTDTKKRELMDSRIMSVRRLIQSMEAATVKPKIFLSSSAIGFYGNRGEENLNETSGSGSGFLSQICKSWENEILKAEELGIRTVIFRLGMVLGHDGGALEKILPAFKIGIGGKLGSGCQWMSWIHIHDFVEMLIHSIENHSIKGIINAVSPNPIQNIEFTKTIGKILNRPTILPVPKYALKIGLKDLSDLLLFSQKVSSRKICESGFKFKFSKIDDAIKEVSDHSYHEIKIEQWIPTTPNKTFKFFKEAKNLEKLTPDFLKFKIVSQSTPQITDGTIITYRLSLHGVPVKWQSKIIDWNPITKFSDIQLKGPYSHWHHTHEFEEKDGGTLIKDHVFYKLPFGCIADLVVGKIIRKDLETIFCHRTKVIDSYMNN